MQILLRSCGYFEKYITSLIPLALSLSSISTTSNTDALQLSIEQCPYNMQLSQSFGSPNEPYIKIPCVAIIMYVKNLCNNVSLTDIP